MVVKFRFVVFSIFIAASGVAIADETDVYVPDDLKPWQEWVLEGKDYRDCPFFFNKTGATKEDYICAWPGRLNLSVDANGGGFSQGWTVYSTEEWVPLPGDISHWPQQVSVDGQPVAVVTRNEAPAIRLAPGRFRISGQFEWEERPRTLRVPPQSGLLDLNIDGERIIRPDRNGLDVWLGEREQERKVEDALQVQAYRLIADDVPIRLTTVLQIEASGSVREESIGPALPPGFIPMSLEGQLPTRLEPDGNLRLQVRPGSWNLVVVARADGIVDTITLPDPQSNMPATEIWSYRSNNELRVTVPEGLTPVDPLQVGVPEDWEELPGFHIRPGEILTIAERSRGKVAADNQLNLTRQFWLDFDGKGFVFSDVLGGHMRDGWRLDMGQPYGLFSATEEDQNLLVTVGAEDGLTGIEVRQPNVDLEAVGRTESRGTLPVTGWRAQFTNVNTILHLPPGNKLFAVIGADRSSTSWVNQWKLLDFFLVLITAISAAKLFGRETGVLSFVALILSLHEPGAPEFIWLYLLVAVGLVRVAPAGRLLQASKAYRNLSFVVLLVVFLPFAADQLRVSIYPQLESQDAPGLFAGYDRTSQTTLYGAEDPKAMLRRERSVAPMAGALKAAPEPIEEVVVSGLRTSRMFDRYPPNATVQVGPGRPAWAWNSYNLNWSGPVDPDHNMRLLIMPRWLTTGLRFIEVLLLGAFVAVFALDMFNRKPPWSGYRLSTNDSTSRIAGSVAAMLIGAATLFVVLPAHADTPSDAVLKQLEQRLLQAPPCVPRCAEIIDANIVIAADAMTIRLTTNSLENVALSLPGSLQGWRPEQLTIDNKPVAQVYRSSDQSLWVRTPKGERVITLRGPLPPVDSLEIPFPTSPRVIAVETSDWFVAGIQDRHLLTGSLQLTRLQQQEDGADATRWESSRFPVFARVEREIDLDLDWGVTTTVYRVAPLQGAITLNVPLLEGESVITEDFTVTDGEILVSMNPAQSSVSWQSNLPRQSPISLQTRPDKPWKEVWRFAIGSVWHADFEGIPESESSETDLSYRIAQFFPRPGESMEVNVERPAATTGDTLVFDTVALSSDIGERSRTSDLQLNYRSTRGAQHAIRLPVDSEVTSVEIDGEVAPLRAENGELRLPILPGQHNVSIAWRNNDSVGFRESVPRVDLGAGVSNIHASLSIPENRWVLASFGPKLGPAVLYWSELVVLLLVAVILGRTKLTPLRARDWLLLGLGFSTFSWYPLALVVAWLLVIDVQRDWKKSLPRWRYNGVQVSIAALSLVALITIVVSLPMGLLGSPDMHVVGNGSHGNLLRWFDDRSNGAFPGAYVLSLPVWIYKVLILSWSLWLSFALLKWLPWVWKQFVADSLWKPRLASTNVPGNAD